MARHRACEFAAAGLFLPRDDPRLPGCLTELPAPPEPTLDSLARTWFGTA